MTFQKLLFSTLLTLASSMAFADGTTQLSYRDALQAMNVLAQNPEALAATTINGPSGAKVIEGTENGGTKTISLKNQICGISVGEAQYADYHVTRSYVFEICTPNSGMGSHAVETLTINSDSLMNSGASTYTFKVVPAKSSH